MVQGQRSMQTHTSIYRGVDWLPVVVGFLCDAISCELARRGVRRGATESSVTVRGNAFGLTSIISRGRFSGLKFEPWRLKLFFCFDVVVRSAVCSFSAARSSWSESGSWSIRTAFSLSASPALRSASSSTTPPTSATRPSPPTYLLPSASLSW